jgi:cyanophycin synthetase
LLLGQGAKQRRVLGARTDRTGALAESISRDPALTRDLLRGVGVPVADEGADARRWRLLTVGGRVAAAVSIDPPADVTAQVSPETAARAVEAAEVVGLDVAGVVVEAGGGGVIAVEADPAVEASAAEAVGESIVAGLFAEGQDGRIPVVAVTGVNGKTTTTRLIAHILSQARHRVGFTCTEGIYVGGRLIEAGDCSGPRSARTVLQHPEVDAAVLETARGGILRAGLGFDRCDVAVVTNVGEGDHLGCGDVDTVEQLARVKRSVVEVVHRGGTAVLAAADPLVAAMAGHCRGSVIFFAQAPEHPVIASHRAAGGRVAFVRGGRIVLAQGGHETPVALLKRVRLTGGGRIGFQIDNALAASAAAWALGVEREAIRQALKSFGCGIDHAPARFNLLEVNGAVAVLDYGHNVSSLLAVVEALEQFPSAWRTAVYTAAGDRRDADLIRQGQILGDNFDRVILYEDEHCARGRKPGEITGLFRRGLADRLRVRKVQEVPGAVRAVDEALTSARRGELLLIQVDVVDETLELVRGYLAGAAAREIGLEEALARGERARELAEARR